MCICLFCCCRCVFFILCCFLFVVPTLSSPFFAGPKHMLNVHMSTVCYISGATTKCLKTTYLYSGIFEMFTENRCRLIILPPQFHSAKQKKIAPKCFSSSSFSFDFLLLVGTVSGATYNVAAMPKKKGSLTSSVHILNFITSHVAVYIYTISNKNKSYLLHSSLVPFLSLPPPLSSGANIK